MTLPGAPLLAGLLLSIVVMSGTLALAAFFPVESFPAISVACRLNNLSADNCQTMALEVGIYSAITYAAVLAAMLWRGWASVPGRPTTTDAKATPLQYLFISGALGLFLVHLALIEFGPIHVSRLNQSEYYSTIISLENLLLPVLLQLYVASKSNCPTRLPLLVALLLGMSLSPYRSMLMALVLFGFALPFLLSAWEAWRLRSHERRWKGITHEAFVLAVICATVVFAGIQDTKTRSPTLLGKSLGVTSLPPENPLPPEAKRSKVLAPHTGPNIEQEPAAKKTESESVAPPPNYFIGRVSQRIVFPLYQSAIAVHLADTEIELPTLTDQVLRKLRLSERPNLEEFLFRRIYGGHGHGQTTSLAFGEASVYFPGPPIIWMLAVPLILILCWRLLARRGFDCGTLFGFALWRSSFSGLFPIMPSLTIQIVGLWVLHRFPLDPLARLARVCLATTLIGSLAMTGYVAIAQISGHRDFLYAGFELKAGCWIQSPSWIPYAVSSVGAENSLPMKPVLAKQHRTAVTLALPYGTAAIPMLNDIAGAVASMSRCKDKLNGRADKTDVNILYHHLVPRVPNPLNILILVILIMIGFRTWQRKYGREEGHQ
ncbi:hypothetical protein [Thalassospira lucentensis]|uniref:hypothetical protein n=1 Tax=Thalassospira lucentensis TaxID=168935 RepID=UPI00142E5A89|nr:hypothetical protein [Thalassospira lucentensis]NIZ01769.1 hypothetical protein [Thalassospira lucentensis]